MLTEIEHALIYLAQSQESIALGQMLLSLFGQKVPYNKILTTIGTAVISAAGEAAEEIASKVLGALGGLMTKPAA